MAMCQHTVYGTADSVEQTSVFRRRLIVVIVMTTFAMNVRMTHETILE
jgi:hypothetical protein